MVANPSQRRAVLGAAQLPVALSRMLWCMAQDRLSQSFAGATACSHLAQALQDELKQKIEKVNAEC